MNIMVFGAGYVGLVQAAGLASTGNKIFLVDINEDRIKALKRGETPIYEPGLTPLLQSGAEKGYLEFVHTEDENFQTLIDQSEVYFLGVQTPEGEKGLPTLDFLFSAVDRLCESASDLSDKFVVVKSTVPVGTGEQLEERFRSKNKKPIVVSNPEFLKQGSAVQDFLKPERVIIGAEDSRAFEVIGNLYKPFMLKRERNIFMGRRSAELVKYACNSFLATKISFINEMARLSERVGADIQEVRKGMISDSRIGDQFLFPGIGYGGSCLPKDTHALVAQGEAVDIELPVVRATDKTNKMQQLWPFEKITKSFGDDLKDRTIAIWGLSFKPNTDDIRAAPSVPVVEKLIAAGATVKAYDPAATKHFAKRFQKEVAAQQVQLTQNPYEAVQEADALLILTEWQEFRNPNFKTLKESLKQTIVIDGRGIYEKRLLEKEGFDYFGIGIPRS